MGRAAIDQLLYSLDRAFEGEESRWHGLVRNLTSLEPERWDDVPAGCVRSALAIVEHVGGALRVYDSQAFVFVRSMSDRKLADSASNSWGSFPDRLKYPESR